MIVTGVPLSISKLIGTSIILKQINKGSKFKELTFTLFILAIESIRLILLLLDLSLQIFELDVCPFVSHSNHSQFLSEHV